MAWAHFTCYCVRYSVRVNVRVSVLFHVFIFIVNDPFADHFWLGWVSVSAYTWTRCTSIFGQIFAHWNTRLQERVQWCNRLYFGAHWGLQDSGYGDKWVRDSTTETISSLAHLSRIWLAYSLYRTHLLGYLEISLLPRYASSCSSTLASCSSQNKFQDCCYRLQGMVFPKAILSRRRPTVVCAYAITAIFGVPVRVSRGHLFKEKRPNETGWNLVEKVRFVSEMTIFGWSVIE